MQVKIYPLSIAAGKPKLGSSGLEVNQMKSQGIPSMIVFKSIRIIENNT